MRRQLILVIVGTVVGITVIAGAGTWFLARQSARTSAISDVLSSAQSFGRKNGGTIPVAVGTATGAKLRRELDRIETIIRLSARLDGAHFLAANDGKVLNNPTDVPTAVLDGIASSGIGPKTAVAGSTGSEAWAAEAVQIAIVGTATRRDVPRVLVLTQQIGGTGLSGEFLILAGAVIAFAIIVSLALSRRITRPLRRAVATTQRIAGGDLEARVGTHSGDLPELSMLAQSIDSMAEGLGRVRNAERQFLLSVSHDLRTPLTSIRGYAEAILDGTVTEPSHAAAIIGNEARRLERLVGDLLDLAKLDARSFSFHFRIVDVAEVVEEVAEELRPLVYEAGLALEVFPPTHPSYTNVDPDRLDQVLANLVENAAKYARSTIRLGTFVNGAEARLVVEDDGPGIGPQEIGRIFDRHYSADRHARPGRPKGSGLGLAIAAELSAAMGARVVAESPIGPSGGTRMIVRLPTVVPSQNPYNSHIST